MSRFGFSHYWEDNMSGSWIAQSVEHSPCKRGVPGLSPGLTAHFSYPVTDIWHETLSSGPLQKLLKLLS